MLQVSFHSNFASHATSICWLHLDVGIYDLQHLALHCSDSWSWLRVFPFWVESQFCGKSW